MSEIKIKASTFNLTDKQKEKYARLRKIINENHPMRKDDKFKDMLKEKLNEGSI